MKSQPEFYFDHAAGTAVDPRVVRHMARLWSEPGNPSSPHQAGRRAAALLDDARTRIGRFFGVRAAEVVLCASGSEANALAIIGSVDAAGTRRHIVTTAIEHRSVLESIHTLRQRGHVHTVVGVNASGVVSADAVMLAIRPTTALVSVMYANNEVGSIQPVRAIGRLIDRYRREHRTQYPLFHIDACQATPWLDMDVRKLGADMVTINGAKVGAPRSTAVLVVCRGVSLTPLVRGGSQEHGLRAGTEDIVGAQGLACALELIKPIDATRVQKLRDHLIQRINAVLPDASINGPLGDARLANNVHIGIPGVTGERLLLELDARGVRAGSGSACTAYRVEPSHVLAAMGIAPVHSEGAVRFSLFRTTTRNDIEYLAQVLPEAVQRARAVYRPA
jgi:cysteine desulfurase